MFKQVVVWVWLSCYMLLCLFVCLSQMSCKVLCWFSMLLGLTIEAACFVSFGFTPHCLFNHGFLFVLGWLFNVSVLACLAVCCISLG